MQKILFCLALLCCLFLLQFPANALTYLDQMDGSGSGARGTTEYLAPVLRSRSLEPADRYQLQVMPKPDGRLRGSVQYLAQGADRISLRIYSAKGTYVTLTGGTLALGTDSGVFRPDPASVSNAYYHPADGKLYAFGESWQVFEQSPTGNFGQFRQVDEVEKGKLIPFGVCVYTSAERGGKTLLPLTRTLIQHIEAEGQLYCVEDFSCDSIPPGATSIWVELNDLEGNLLSKTMRTSLAWVMVQGTSLTMGPLRESTSPGVSSPPSQSSWESSSSKASSKSSSKASSKSSPKAAPDTSAKSSLTGGSGSAAISSALDGQVSSKAPSSSLQKEKSSTTEDAAFSTAENAQPELPHYFHREADPLVYQVQIPPQEMGVDWGVVVYLALVSGIILYLLLRPRGK
ncbi:MAG: hypothetical protein ACOX0K_08030 [Oscillospiraceae bacterium]